MTYFGARLFVAHISGQGHGSSVAGCFKIKYRRHSSASLSLKEMFNLVYNTGGATRIVRRPHTASSEWLAAVGWFYSRTPNLACWDRSRYGKGRAAQARPSRQPDLRQATEDAFVRAARASQPGNISPVSLRLVNSSEGINGALVRTIGPGDLVLLPALDVSWES